jgi:uncharacterized protein
MKKVLLPMFLVVLGFFVCVFIATPGAFGKNNLKKILVVTTTTGFRHSSIPTAEKTLQKLAKETGVFSMEIAGVNPESAEFKNADGSADTNKIREAIVKVLAEKMSADKLKSYDGIIFANTTGDLPLPDKQAFLAWIKSGKAFVGMHSATDTFRGHKPLDPYVEMIGGEFKGHPPGLCDVECINQDPKHPACKHIGATWKMTDEIYILNGYEQNKVHELLTLDKHPREQTPGHFPIAWCKKYGKGKVFYTSFGHSEATWENPDYQKHIIGGIKWALGLEKGDAKPQTK